MLAIKILTAYPDIFPGSLKHSIIGKALKESKETIPLHFCRRKQTQTYSTALPTTTLPTYGASYGAYPTTYGLFSLMLCYHSKNVETISTVLFSRILEVYSFFSASYCKSWYCLVQTRVFSKRICEASHVADDQNLGKMYDQARNLCFFLFTMTSKESSTVRARSIRLCDD